MTRRFGASVLAISISFLAACGDDGATPADDGGSGGPSSTSATMTSTEGDPTSADGSTSPASTDGGSTGTSASTDEGSSGSGDSTAAASTEGSGSESSGSTGEGSTGDSSTGVSACTPIVFSAVGEEGFTGDGYCEGVQTNAVLADATEVAAHHDAWCNSVAACIIPPPPCAPTPDLPAAGEQIVYVFGVTSGCTALATIADVLDCGDTIEVHYTIVGGGMCGTIVNAWAAASIPASDAEVVFIED